ncbi:hypothetical protein FEM48_Zijuj05G0026400 [Ziziphus jujuba var. spinosa]|uniref:ABC transporter domain-containing protein n=1 Tax=Ziziphus jujuba var. spinosa TaxID=714518 RepID=A0A978VCC0_ZIZJJ|nr:hypothetical protein FEM48_Zijuj05G0026400 [Ziziphus jujuba var. spinosa]
MAKTVHTALPFPNQIRGGFKDTLPDDLLAAILKAVIEKKNLNTGEVGDVVVGTVSATGLQRATECRKAAFYAGFPGIGAVLESMTINKMNRVTKVNPKVEIFTHARDCLLPDGITSENVVQRYGVTSEEQDMAAVILTSLVYDKEKKLIIMMKMHGLGDATYWTISYAYFLFISLIYMLSLVLFGSVLGLVFFRMNDYTIQFVFYFVYANLQISLAFLVAAFSSNVKTASGIYIYIWNTYILVFGSGLVREFLFRSFIEDLTFSRSGMIALELYPRFSLYRGIYKLSQYGTKGIHIRTGMNWRYMNDGVNGMKEALFIMLIEWLVVLLIVYYAEKVQSSGSGRNPLIFLNKLWKKNQRQRRNTSVLMDMPDVIQEVNYSSFYLFILFAFQHRIVQAGECFGLLGPNGARKTSFLSMMTGLTKPSSGTTFVQEREHLLFYGRLKKLRGSALRQVVYMDEPSTGLDPASKNSLWNVMKHAKQNRAIILTKFFCDRLGIMANGSLQCIGNSKELKARYGGTYAFTMTTSLEHEEDVENLVRSLSINAKKIYHLSGTQKYELPKDEVRIVDVYRAVEYAKYKFTVSAWGLTDTSGGCVHQSCKWGLMIQFLDLITTRAFVRQTAILLSLFSSFFFSFFFFFFNIIFCCGFQWV